MMIDFKTDMQQYFTREMEVIKNLDINELNSAMNAIYDAWQREAVIYVFGNGGSSATASHMVCDFNKGISDGHAKKFRLQCLNDNMPIISAIANDISYDDVFSYQLEKILRTDDLIVAISGSGNSKNIMKAVEYAKQIGTKIVGITGYDGGKLKKIANYSMHVPINDMQIAEDIHMIFDHMMMHIFSCHRRDIIDP
ncbi:SIS domain-containing protein [Megasphaera paucivorans]|uniref:D-sedoheptulose 7-phosphate isomerase n=1 Tax=Megasphaera paucivorans TaxID=349095 RepID=A0A1G9W241_9FIRM|nr:SIS domain-containing protein [Megasphaera paucivorans]SDM78570.1 D-sedoheptulose 7-phosphate isomerase [Megasphaera paucivorans]